MTEPSTAPTTNTPDAASRGNASEISPPERTADVNDLVRLNELTQRIIGAAIEVHRLIGPGLAERIYAEAMSIEFQSSGIRNEREVRIPVVYKGYRLGHYVLDFLVDRAVVVEIKSVDRCLPVFEAQLMNYMKLADVRIGLLINFNSRLVKEGIKRLIL